MKERGRRGPRVHQIVRHEQWRWFERSKLSSSPISHHPPSPFCSLPFPSTFTSLPLCDSRHIHHCRRPRTDSGHTHYYFPPATHSFFPFSLAFFLYFSTQQKRKDERRTATGASQSNLTMMMDYSPPFFLSLCSSLASIIFSSCPLPIHFSTQLVYPPPWPRLPATPTKRMPLKVFRQVSDERQGGGRGKRDTV